MLASEHCIEREANTLNPQAPQQAKFRANLHDSTKPIKQIPAQVEFLDLWADLADRLPAVIRIAAGSVRARRIGVGKLDAIEDDELQLVELGLLAPDLFEADLLRYLAREDDFPWWVLVFNRVPGILELQGREEGLGRICRARGADEGCRCRGFLFAWPLLEGELN